MNPTEELAARMGSMEWSTIRRLLDAGADIDVRDGHDMTLLMCAVSEHALDWCTELLKRGAGVHVRDYNGWTAWNHLCSYNCDSAFYSLFLQYGADVNEYNPRGWTVLHWACLNDQYPLILVLLAQGADPRLPIVFGPYKGRTAYELGDRSFWGTPAGRRARLLWDTVSIQEVFIVASEEGIVPVPSYLW